MEELDIKTAIQIAKILAAAPDERIPMILDVFSKACEAYAGRWNRVPPEHGRLHRPTRPCTDHDRIPNRNARQIRIGEQTAADV